MDFFENRTVEILIKQLEAAAVPSVMTDLEGAVRYCNAAALELAPGLSKPGGLASVVSADQLEEGMRRARMGESFSFATSPLGSGTVIFRGSPLFDGETPCGALITFGVGLADSALPQLLGDSGAYALEFCLRRTLSDIFAGMSVVNSRAQFLRDKVISEQIYGINRLNYQLMRNTSNMIQAMRFCSGQRPEPRLCDFWAETAELMAACSTALRPSKIYLEYKLPELPAYIECDYPSVAVALVNIIANAARACGRTGTIEVNGKMLTGSALLTISDNGCGIAPQDMDRIFTPYFSAFEDDFQSVGLGLPVAQQILDSFGGTVTVQSEQGEGSTFAVTLPASDALLPDKEIALSSGAAEYLRDRFSPVYVNLCDVVMPPEP